MLDLIDRQPLMEALDRWHERNEERLAREAARLPEMLDYKDVLDHLPSLAASVVAREYIVAIRGMVREAPTINPDIGDLRNADISLIVQICHRGTSKHVCSSCLYEGRADRQCPRFVSDLLISVLYCDGHQWRPLSPGLPIEPVKLTNAHGGLHP